MWIYPPSSHAHTSLIWLDLATLSPPSPRIADHCFNTCSAGCPGEDLYAPPHTLPPLPPRIADHLLQHLYRWVSSPASQLHHASLHRAVNTLMAKLFAQLVAELRRWEGGEGITGVVLPPVHNHPPRKPAVGRCHEPTGRPLSHTRHTIHTFHTSIPLLRLGATIVSANFNSIRLCTGKRDVKAAVG